MPARIDHARTAEELFRRGYNCAQAVCCAFCDVTGLDIDDAARLASSFGGGLGRLRETCGTVSGAAMVLGAVYGYSEPGSAELKNAHYELVREFARRFRERCGSIVCRELLSAAGVDPAPGGTSAPRTPDFYRKRPCPKLAYEAARIVDELLAERGPSVGASTADEEQCSGET